MRSTYETERSNHAVLVGTYGSGKSHTLKYISRFVNNQLNKKNRRAIAFYIPHPGSGILDVYRSIVTELGPSLMSKLSMFVDDQSHYRFELYRPIRIISQKSNETLNAWRWLTGERLEIEQRNRIGVGRNIDDAFAIQAFKQVMILLKRAGYAFIAICLDELETVNELDILRRQKLFNTFRHLLDDNPKNLSVIFACTPAGWDEILANAYALARRISRNVIYLDNLDENRLASVISGYMQNCRTDIDALKKHLNEAEETKECFSIYPFTRSALTEIIRLSQGNIGEAMKYCNLAIDRAVASDCKYVDGEAFNRLLPEFQR